MFQSGTRSSNIEYENSPWSHRHIERDAQRTPLLDKTTPIPLKNLKQNFGKEISFHNTTELWCECVTPPMGRFSSSGDQETYPSLGQASFSRISGAGKTPEFVHLCLYPTAKKHTSP